MKELYTTREFIEVLRICKSDFYDLKAIDTANFPKPVRRGRNGFIWSAEDCRQYAADHLKRKADALKEQANQIAAEAANII